MERESEREGVREREGERGHRDARSSKLSSMTALWATDGLSSKDLRNMEIVMSDVK